MASSAKLLPIDFIVVQYEAPVDRVVADIEATVPATDRNIIVVDNHPNKGWTQGNLDGLALGRAPLVCLINPDVRLQAGWLEAALPAFIDPKVALVGPRSIVPPHLRWWGVGPEMVAGWLMLLRREWATLLDPRFFLMFSDTDLNRQITGAGHRIRCLDLPVKHDWAGMDEHKNMWMRVDGTAYREKWSIPRTSEPLRLYQKGHAVGFAASSEEAHALATSLADTAQEPVVIEERKTLFHVVKP